MKVKDLKSHVLFKHANSIIEACSPLNHLGIQGFIFMRRFPDRTFIDLSNQLKWSEDFLLRYLKGNVNVKNAQDHMLIQPGISLWSQNPNNSIWIEGRVDWGFHSGISIAREGANWMDIFCFYSRRRPLEMDVEFLKNFHLLDKFNLQFVERFHDVIRQGENHRLVTPHIYTSHEPEPQSQNQKRFLESINGRRAALSVRERECIFYIAKGNTASQVGKILHLSRRTVETYLQSAKEKLFVKTLSDLIKLYPEW